MTVTQWWLGEPTETTATLSCRSNATAAVTVGCNGQLYTAAADTSVNDGVVHITVTGLLPDRRYPYTIDGVEAGTLRTKKTSGEVWISSGSCWSSDRADILGHRLLKDFDIDLFIALGDFPYANTQKNSFGENCVDVESSVAAGKVFANYTAHHRQVRNMPGVRELMQSVPFMYMPDDHEYPFNNAAKTDLTNYQSVVGAESATQDDLDEAWAVSKSAIDAYTLGCWTVGFNSDAATVDTDAIYGSYRIGHVEVFLIDCINYRDPPSDVDSESKTMIGAAQKARLINAVTNSTATFKLIASGKGFWQGVGNDDSWGPDGAGLGYQIEREEILYALRNVTGLLSVAGDQHGWSDQQIAVGELGEGYPAFSCLVGCPTGVGLFPTMPEGYTTAIKQKVNGYPSATMGRDDNVVTVLRFTADRVYRYLLSTNTGLISCGHIDAGSNQVQYQRTRIG